jgi:class 3 adenylate cyclase
MVADDFDEVTVLFCEICNFHSFASRYSPQVVIAVLNVIYSRFDSLIDKYKVHKVRAAASRILCCGMSGV